MNMKYDLTAKLENIILNCGIDEYFPEYKNYIYAKKIIKSQLAKLIGNRSVLLIANSQSLLQNLI